jgi:hypothetical protein
MATQKPPSATISSTSLENWTGLVGESGIVDHLQIRDIRNTVCRIENRPVFSHRVAGDHFECVKGMACGILGMLMELTSAPRGALAANIFHIHVTSVSSVLDEKRWPSAIQDVSDLVLQATLWMFLGKGWHDCWEKFKDIGRSGAEIQGFLEQHKNDPQTAAQFLTVQYAMDLRDFFFPEPKRPATVQPDEQAAVLPLRSPAATWSTWRYFDPVRRDWGSPFDYDELGRLVEWTRRIVKASGDRLAYIGLFVPTATAFEAVYRNELSRTNIAYGPRESRGRFRIDVFYPSRLRRSQDDESRFKLWRERLASVAEQRATIWKRLPLVDKETEQVRFIAAESPIQQQSLLDLPLRAITSYMFLGYYYELNGEKERFERLFLLRHILQDERKTPLMLDFTEVELREFVIGACRRYHDFDTRLTWFRSGGISDPESSSDTARLP